MNRIYRIKDENYTTISNLFLRDKELSLKAKGFLALIMSLPEKWDFSINGICTILPEGKTAIYSTISELRSKGYCEYTTIRDNKGRMIGHDYTFYQQPNPDIPRSEPPHPDSPNVGNQTQLSIEKELNIDKNNKRFTSTIVDVPTADAAAENSDEKEYTLQHRCRLYFEDVYYKAKGVKFYYTPKEAGALKQLLAAIKFSMPENEKNNESAIETNFKVFIDAIFQNMQRLNSWVYDNLSISTINSNFNRIYSQLTNGISTNNPNDNFRIFGSRNVSPDILKIFT